MTHLHCLLLVSLAVCSQREGCHSYRLHSGTVAPASLPALARGQRVLGREDQACLLASRPIWSDPNTVTRTPCHLSSVAESRTSHSTRVRGGLQGSWAQRVLFARVKRVLQVKSQRSACQRPERVPVPTRCLMLVLLVFADQDVPAVFPAKGLEVAGGQ